jgi:ferredoxin
MKTYAVEFRKSGRTLQIPENGIILEHALRSGLNVVFGCQGGSCGTCMVLVEGETQQWGRCIDAEEKAQGYALICSAYPCSDLVIDA